MSSKHFVLSIFLANAERIDVPVDPAQPLQETLSPTFLQHRLNWRLFVPYLRNAGVPLDWKDATEKTRGDLLGLEILGRAQAIGPSIPGLLLLDRSASCAVLNNFLETDGYFIIRPNLEGEYLIDFTNDGTIKHFKVVHDYEGPNKTVQFGILNKRFGTIEEMISYYTTYGIKSKATGKMLTLRHPITKEMEAELRANTPSSSSSSSWHPTQSMKENKTSAKHSLVPHYELGETPHASPYNSPATLRKKGESFKSATGTLYRTPLQASTQASEMHNSPAHDLFEHMMESKLKGTPMAADPITAPPSPTFHSMLFNGMRDRMRERRLLLNDDVEYNPEERGWES